MHATGRTGRTGAVAAAAVAVLTLPLVAQVPPPRLYVTNQDDATVSIIDAGTRRLIETLDLQPLGFGPNARPHHAQVEPDGSFWYVTLIGAGKVLKLDRENRIVGSVDLEVPGLIALHPAADLLVVARSMSAVNPPRRIALVRRSDMTLLDEYEVVFPRPHALVVDPRGDFVYVGSLGENQLASIRCGRRDAPGEREGPPLTLTVRRVAGCPLARGHGTDRERAAGVRHRRSRGAQAGTAGGDEPRAVRAGLHLGRPADLRDQPRRQHRERGEHGTLGGGPGDRASRLRPAARRGPIGGRAVAFVATATRRAARG
jgi:YVTN family beta-propeller protein